jgi:chromosome segregation ATPase
MPRLKKLVRATKNKAISISKSRHVKNPRTWAPMLILVLAIVFWALPTFVAKAPGQLGYGIKRSEEAVISNLAPLPSWRESLKLDFANNRVAEAAYVANQANQNGHSSQTKTAATINGLLGTYEDVYETRTATLNQKLKDNTKPSKANLLEYQTDAADTYDELQLLRLQAPSTSQLAVLTSIDDTQQNLAVLNDALGLRPLSNSDLSELAKLVPVGVVTQAQVDQLTAIPSSRLLHVQLVNMINSGQLPSDITYVLDQDLIKQADRAHAKSFAAVSEFEQMQRISAVVAASRPSSAQQKEIQAFITAYKPGQTLPTDNTQQYATPIVYGIALSGRLLTDLSSLKPVHMSSDNQALMNSWAKVVDPPNLSIIYERLMTGAQTDPQLALRNMTRMQQELVDAQKAQVSYLVMPPGWSSSQLPVLNQQMGIEIAQTTFAASKPDVDQQLAEVLSIQNQLQSKLDALQQSNTKTITELQTKIDSFTGTPEQLATLKDQLAALVQAQATTVTNLQTQITAITAAHTQLDDKIDKLRQDQLTSLYELEIRATNTAQTLTNSVKSDLTTKLNQVETSSQTLISNLGTKVNNLGTDQTQLKTQLNGEITTIKSNYQTLKTDVQSQLDAGVATSAGLQTSLSQAQSTLASQQTQLTSLGTSSASLTTFVNQLKTNSETQINSLQNQIDVVKLDQQTTQTAVSDLQTITQTSTSLINGLQTRVDGLDAGQNTLRNQLTSSIATVRDDQAQFAAYVQAQIAAGAATSASLQTTLQTVQTSLTQQASQLSSLSTGASALTTLVNQVKTNAETQADNLQSQIDGLKIDQQTVKTSITTLRDQQTTAINQVNGQVASLTVLQAEAGAAINVLGQQATQAQTQISTLTNSFTTLQTAVGTIGQTQATLQANVADQQSELDSLTTQTQSALSSLTTQQTQLATQVNNLAANVTTLSQTVSTIQTASNATQTQLNTLLANPPWAIPAGTYVTQSEFDTLSAQINTQFAAKSAALDAQFTAYQTQLNATVSQLSSQVQTLTTTTTNTANTQTQQQTQINTLNSQVQALQTQVQQLLSAAPHTGL